MVKLFFDFEFSGLTIKTTPISLGIISDDGQQFYAEFNDYSVEQCDEWINDNVVANLLYNDSFMYFENNTEEKLLSIKDNKAKISEQLLLWLKQFKKVEFWGDSVAFDWVLMADLLGMGTAMRRYPKNFEYNQAFDVFTALKMIYNKPKTPRHEMLGLTITNQHNALYDAKITKQIYDKYIKNNLAL